MDSSTDSIRFEFDLSKADYSAFWWRSILHPKFFRQIISIWLVFFAVVFLTKFNEWKATESWAEITYHALKWSGVIAAVSLAIFLLRWRFYPLFNGPVGRQCLELSVEGFTVTDENHHERFFPLETLRFVSDSNRHMFFYLGSRDGFPLPKSAFENETFADQLYGLLVNEKDRNLPGIVKQMLAGVDQS